MMGDHAMRMSGVPALLLASVLAAAPASGQGPEPGAPTGANAEEVTALRARAEGGDAEAQTDLGALLLLGQGLPQDDAAAAEWFQRAAKQGYAPAQQTLGALYAFGRGVGVDLVLAARWYEEAANQGLPVAQGALGMAYASGAGVAQDFVSAYMWLSLAVDESPAAERQRFSGLRDLIAEQMDGDQIDRARLLAREWEPQTR